MAVSILEALQNANYNLKNPISVPMAKQQLHNAVVLLEKGYDIDDEIEPILEKWGSVENAPEKE